MRMISLAVAAAVAVAAAAPVEAQTVAVTSLGSAPLPATSDGTTFTAPTTDYRLGATATMSSDTTLEANGSLQLSGDRTRVYNNLTGAGIAANTLESLTGDYLVTNGGSGGIQSPAFRVYVLGADGRQAELIWEAAYNGGYTLGQKDAVGSADLFWHQIVGQGFDGTGGIGQGSYILQSLSAWGDTLGGSVLGVGVGNGSGASTSFNSFADNLSLTAGGTVRTYDFQATAAVPEPSTWALMLLGFGGMGVAMRRQRRNPALAQVA